MITYADSSVLIAWFHADDVFARTVTAWVQDNVTDFLWNPILRTEVRHNLRQLRTTYARTAWNALRAAEKSGRLNLRRERIDQLLQATEDLSAEKAGSVSAGTWDFFHVAAAMESGAECFATCDQLQAALARAIGSFRQVKLFRP